MFDGTADASTGTSGLAGPIQFGTVRYLTAGSTIGVQAGSPAGLVPTALTLVELS